MARRSRRLLIAPMVGTGSSGSMRMASSHWRDGKQVLFTSHDLIIGEQMAHSDASAALVTPGVVLLVSCGCTCLAGVAPFTPTPDSGYVFEGSNRVRAVGLHM